MHADLSRWPRADEILDQALTLPPAERLAWVAMVAGGDGDLRQALEAVIAESLRPDAFLIPGGALAGELGHELAGSADERPRMRPGTRIEHYEVGDLIGRGGMGEVYHAVDTRLHREVALKVLPDRFAQDAERLARFRREARVLATLSAPGVAAIYGVAEGAGVEALVLELVEGPTLAERLAAGPLPLKDVIRIGRALVEAVAAAHARGILHRDLKPANIKLTADGGVKVLDFGLAKALTGEATPGSTVPTDLTGGGPARVVGTLAYMSPEQMRGDALDARADIWAFGCVLFEMLTGTRAFAGDAPADLIARVLEREPAFSLLPPATPAALRRLLRHTLEKDPRRRLTHIVDARLDLDDALTEPVIDRPAAAPTPWWWLAAAMAGMLVAGAAAGAAFMSRRLPAPPLTRFEVTLPEGDRPPLNYQPSVALSPDGRTLVYRAERDGVVRLYRRALDQLVATPLEGTEGATGPFFSGDGGWIGFDSGGMLRRTPARGGRVETIGAAPGAATATWLADGSVVFATNTQRALRRMPAAGGEAVDLTVLDAERGDTMHLLPQALPDGRTLLYTIVSGAERRVAALRLDTGETTVLAPGSHGRHLASGHIVLLRDGTLWRLPFDARTLTVVGPGVALADDVAQTDGTVGHYDVSPNGALAYLRRQDEVHLRRLVWVDREGGRTPAVAEARNYSRVSLSADGSRMAATIEQDGNTDVWVGSPGSAGFSRVTRDPTIETMPALTPDGAAVAFRSERDLPGVFLRDAQGAGPVERLTETSGPIHSPYGWTPDGRTLLLAIFRGFKSQAIARVTPPSTEVDVLLDGDFAQLDPQVSPDGRWMAYQSDESGAFEIYVRPYPDVRAGRWQVSRRGGMSPRWNANGRELFFFDGGGLTAVPVTASATFSAGTPRRLFPIAPVMGNLGTDYEVAAYGRRFLFILPETGPPPPRAAVVWALNWLNPLE